MDSKAWLLDQLGMTEEKLYSSCRQRDLVNKRWVMMWFYRAAGKSFPGRGVLSVFHHPVSAIHHAAPGLVTHFAERIKAEITGFTINQACLAALQFRMPVKVGQVIGHVLQNIIRNIQRLTILIHFRCIGVRIFQHHNIRIIAGGNYGVQIIVNANIHLSHF